MSLQYLASALENVPSEWLSVLTETALTPIDDQLLQARQAGSVIYPPAVSTFHALQQLRPSQVRVVMLGQDPYHGEHQATGMSFSVQKTVRIPPSLRNIYKELHQDIGFSVPKHGDLSDWARQGVLLLNSVLTVEAGLAASHSKFGWQTITDRLIELVNEKSQRCVFMLWGNWAISKSSLVNSDRHLILTASHPSPLSANRGFLGCKHFSQANEWLAKHRKIPIDWTIK